MKPPTLKAMPEGHSIRIAVDRQKKLLGGKRVRVSSPQGRFTDAAGIDGQMLRRVEGAGKHLFYHFASSATDLSKNASILHVHLGRLGRFRYHDGDPPPPSPGCRLRLHASDATLDLSGPTACHLIDNDARRSILARLGPDPLRTDADPTKAWERIHRSKKAIGALLLDQSIIAGLGNIFRAEILFRLKLHPILRGDELTRKQFNAIWKDSAEVMALGVKYGWIITTRERDIGKPLAKAKGPDRFYVYKRKTCRVCESKIQTLTLASRTLYFCPSCQAKRPALKKSTR